MQTIKRQEFNVLGITYTVRGGAYIFGRLKVTYNHTALVLLSQEGEFAGREDL